MAEHPGKIPSDPEARKAKGFDRTGQTQTYRQKLTTQLNWLLRCAMGANTLGNATYNWYWVQAHKGWKEDLTEEQRAKLLAIKESTLVARDALKAVEKEIREYYALPKPLIPSKRRQRALKTAQNSAQALEKVN